MRISPKIFGIGIVAAFVAGSFAASPELRAYASTIANDVQCTACVGTSDIAGNAVTAAKIRDGEVKAAEIATAAVGSNEIASDAVGASEIQGVSKLTFADCTVTFTASFSQGLGPAAICSVPGADIDDNAIVSHNQNICYVVSKVDTDTDTVFVAFRNVCSTFGPLGTTTISIMVYDT